MRMLRGEKTMSAEFAGDLKILLRDLLKREFGDDIRKDIREFKENMNGLRRNPNYHKALGRILELIMTNSWWRPLREKEEYKKQFNLYHEKFGDEGFKTESGKKRILGIGNQFATINKEKAVEKVNKLIEILIERGFTIYDWTETLHNLAKNKKTEILGDKGRDNYLRDFGYFKRAPLDRHEWRFIVRTGIYHHHT